MKEDVSSANDGNWLKWTGESPWARTAEDVVVALSSSATNGLDESVIQERCDRFGLNRKTELEHESAFLIFIRQFRSLIILLLLVAAVLSLLLQDLPETIAILVVILINSQIGFWTELKGRRSMEALLRLGHVRARVIRGGRQMQIDAEELVPGDLVVLEGGDIVSADLRLLEASNLEMNEASLTGESLPVAKSADPLAADTLLHDRKNLLFQGTFAVRGSAKGIVVSTGDATEIGRISEMVTKAKESLTPLEKRLEALGRRLILITLLIAVFILLVGFLRGHDPIRMLETAIALAVAAIPEGLPVVATIALASGMRLMARRNAIITRLSSVETLGATGIICTDKTGTLTENRMEARWFVREPDVPAVNLDEGGEPLEKLLEKHFYPMILCNNATWDERESKGLGDPTEVALIKAALRAGLNPEDIRSAHPRRKEIPFDSDSKKMATWNQEQDGSLVIWMKGAPSEILSRSEFILVEGAEAPLDSTGINAWEASIRHYASQGFRLIGFAYRMENVSPQAFAEDPYQHLVFLGFAALSDPPRTDVSEAISLCRKAGIRVVMLTGDQPETARYVAQEVGLLSRGASNSPAGSTSSVLHGRDLPELAEIESKPALMEQIAETAIFARITPRQKLDLIEFYQNRGAVVAMTGDGVNDAPALKKADIGIAMGQRGTQVAMDASDMVLRDDAFSTIVTAIKHGRIIYNNIRQFILYLMSCNMSEILVVASLTAFGAWLNDHLFGPLAHLEPGSALFEQGGLALMLTPLQILFLNLVTDVFPALAIGVGKGDETVMKEPPRRKQEQILTTQHWLRILIYGLLLSFMAFGAVILRAAISPITPSQTIALLFYSLAFGQLLHVFNMRRSRESIFRNEITRNPWIWSALILCTVLLLVIQWIPSLRDLLSAGGMDALSWAALAGCGLVLLIVGQWIAGSGRLAENA